MEWIKINEDGKVELEAEEIKLIPEVQTLLSLAYNKQKGDNEGRKKYRALEELKYMYLAYSPKSPYRDFTQAERLAEAKIDCNFPEAWIESPELQAVIAKYQRSSLNKVANLLKTVTGFLDKFDTHLNTLNLNERLASGGLVHSPKSIMETLERLPRLAQTLQELEIQAKLGIITKTSSRGDSEVGWMALEENKRKNDRDNTTEPDDPDDQGEV